MRHSEKLEALNRRRAEEGRPPLTAETRRKQASRPDKRQRQQLAANSWAKPKTQPRVPPTPPAKRERPTLEQAEGTGQPADADNVAGPVRQVRHALRQRPCPGSWREAPTHRATQKQRPLRRLSKLQAPAPQPLGSLKDRTLTLRQEARPNEGSLLAVPPPVAEVKAETQEESSEEAEESEELVTASDEGPPPPGHAQPPPTNPPQTPSSSTTHLLHGTAFWARRCWKSGLTARLGPTTVPTGWHSVVTFSSSPIMWGSKPSTWDMAGPAL